jgi:hypothetical protein
MPMGALVPLHICDDISDLVEPFSLRVNHGLIWSAASLIKSAAMQIHSGAGCFDFMLQN